MKRLMMLVAVGLLAVACSNPDTAETTTTGVDGATTTTAVGGSSPTSSTTTSAPSEPSRGGSLQECMVGTWELDAAAFFEMITESTAGSDAPGEFVHLGGVNQIVASADGTFVDQRIDWTFGVTTEFGNLEMTINQTRTGTWSASDDVITTLITDPGTREFTMSVDGVPFEVPGGVLPVDPPDSSIDAGVATCTDSVLTVTVDGYASMWTRTA